MKMKFIALLLGFFLLGTFVVAEIYDSSEVSSGNQEYSLDLAKGWNLVSVYFETDFFDSMSERLKNDLKEQGVSVAYFYDRYEGEYIQLYPNPEKDKLARFTQNMGDPENGGDMGEYGAFANSALWVYMEKEGEFSFRTFDGPLKLSSVNIKSGWNFLTITSEMSEDFTGSCDIQGAYFWDSFSRKWLDFPVSNPQSFSWDGDSVFGYGIIVKVSSDCRLGGSSSSSTTLPSLPGMDDSDDDDDAVNLDDEFLIEQDIGPFIFMDSHHTGSGQASCEFSLPGEACEIYEAEYGISSEGLDGVLVQIEIPVSSWEFTEETFSRLDAGLGDDVYSDDEYEDGNFYWYSAYAHGEDDSLTDFSCSWSSNGKLIRVIAEDYDRAEFDLSPMADFLNAYFAKYPSDY